MYFPFLVILSMFLLNNRSTGPVIIVKGWSWYNLTVHWSNMVKLVGCLAIKKICPRLIKKGYISSNARLVLSHDPQRNAFTKVLATRRKIFHLTTQNHKSLDLEGKSLEWQQCFSSVLAMLHTCQLCLCSPGVNSGR